MNKLGKKPVQQFTDEQLLKFSKFELASIVMENGWDEEFGDLHPLPVEKLRDKISQKMHDWMQFRNNN